MLEPDCGRIVSQVADGAIRADHLRRPAWCQGGQFQLGKGRWRAGGGILPKPALQSGKAQPMPSRKLAHGKAGLEKPLRPLRALGRFGVKPTRQDRGIIHACDYARRAPPRQMHPAGRLQWTCPHAARCRQ